jgi:hypothetical protein
MLEQADVERRHAHEARRPRHQREDLVGVEFLQEQHRPAGEQQRVRRDEEPVGVEHRERVDEHVVAREAPVVDEGERIRGKVVVRQHRALGAPRCPGRVEDGGEVLGAARDVREGVARTGRGLRHSATPVGAEGHRVGDAGLRGDRDERRHAARVAHEHPRLGVAEEVRDLGRRVGGVEGQEHRPGAHAAEVEEDDLDALLDLDGDAVPRPDPEADEGVGVAAGAALHLAVGDHRCVGGLDAARARAGAARADEVEEVVGHRLSNVLFRV